MEQHLEFDSLPCNRGAGDRMRYEERPQFSSALTQATFSLTPGRRIEKGATSIRSRRGSAVSFRAASRDRRLELPSSPQDGNESLRGGFPHGFPPHILKIFMSSLSSRQDLEASLPWGGAAAVAAAQPRSSPRRRSGRSELLVAPRNRAYEYEYCHTLRQRCAIPLVGSQLA